MAQVDIVTISGKKYREYEIEPGDNLTTICLRHGQSDWNAVYENDANGAFRTRFPDPNDIDYVNPVNLFIPLVAVPTGASSKGSPSTDFFIAKIKMDDDSQAATTIKLKHIHAIVEANEKADIAKIEIDANGEIIISNPPAGSNYLGSGDYMLVKDSDKMKVFAPTEVPSDKLNGSIDPYDHFELTLNDTDEIVLRKVFYIACPLCGKTFITVKPQPLSSDNLCPDDGYNLSDLEREIEGNETSFSSPATGQNPRSAGNKCRGTGSLTTIYGAITTYWDESRFVDFNGGDYKFKFGSTVVDIIGRATWGAGPLDPDPGREWKFQATGIQPTNPYKTVPIPNNENLPLAVNVLKWITIHHTTDTGINSYATATDLQQKEQGEASADIPYQYLIDFNGDIYEGRPLGIKGTHTTPFNGGNIGIAVAGDFESRWQNGFDPDIPSLAIIDSITLLVEVLTQRFAIDSVWYHQERAAQAGLSIDYTECCGEELIPHVQPLRIIYPGTTTGF